MPRNRTIKPRVSSKRFQGKKLLGLVPTFDLAGDGRVPVTTARNFIKENSITFPAVVNVRRTQFTIDRFFLSESGVFGVDYTEINWTLFPCLNKVAKEAELKGLFFDLFNQDLTSEVEAYKPEYSFI